MIHENVFFFRRYSFIYKTCDLLISDFQCIAYYLLTKFLSIVSFVTISLSKILKWLKRSYFFLINTTTLNKKNLFLAVFVQILSTAIQYSIVQVFAILLQ